MTLGIFLCLASTSFLSFLIKGFPLQWGEWSHRVLKSHILDPTISKGVIFVPSIQLKKIPEKDSDWLSLVKCLSLHGVVGSESGSYRTNKASGATSVYKSSQESGDPCELGNQLNSAFDSHTHDQQQCKVGHSTLWQSSRARLAKLK